MRSIRLLLVAAAVALSACGAAAEPQIHVIPVPTQPPPVGQQACMQALLVGTLTTDPRWGIAVRGSDGTVIHVLWPHGYVGRETEAGIELLDGAGRVVGRVPDRIELGGGLGADDSIWFACG